MGCPICVCLCVRGREQVEAADFADGWCRQTKVEFETVLSDFSRGKNTWAFPASTSTSDGTPCSRPPISAQLAIHIDAYLKQCTRLVVYCYAHHDGCRRSSPEPAWRSATAARADPRRGRIRQGPSGAFPICCRVIPAGCPKPGSCATHGRHRTMPCPRLHARRVFCARHGRRRTRPCSLVRACPRVFSCFRLQCLFACVARAGVSLNGRRRFGRDRPSTTAAAVRVQLCVCSCAAARVRDGIQR